MNPPTPNKPMYISDLLCGGGVEGLVSTKRSSFPLARTATYPDDHIYVSLSMYHRELYPIIKLQ